MTKARVVLHLPEATHHKFRTMRIYGVQAAVETLVLAKGGTVVVADRPPELWSRDVQPGDGDLHIVENGHTRGDGYLNSAVAYLDGFFHLDPLGVLADSSIASRDYDPAAVDAKAAAGFFALLQARFADSRRSRYGQLKVKSDLPDGAIAVFLQGPKPERQGQAFVSTPQMLQAASDLGQATGRPVLVKVHPVKPDLGQAQIAKARAKGAVLIDTDANVHDILARAAVSISINSATGFEGFLHGTPAIFCGRTDFPQCVQVVRRVGDFPAALQAALAAKPDYARAMTWYFRQNCLWLDAPERDSHILRIFAEAGFSPERLGLTL